MKSLLSVLLFIWSASLWAQKNTVGLLSSDTSRIFKGYNLLYPEGQSTVFLVDNAGQIVHTWTDALDARPGNMVYLMKDGSILKTKKSADDNGNPIKGEGSGGTVEKRDWNNKLVWTFTLNDSFNRLHHTIEPLPNGNILMLCRERKTKAQAIAKGRNPATVIDVLWTERIIEVKPIDSTHYTIVWEWHAWDHLVQHFDSTKPNYGLPLNNPHKIDINFAAYLHIRDWATCNSISYNIGLDMIVVSCPSFNEIWMIDHSTTKAQAATDLGGHGLRGGDLMYRWGNPVAYGYGSSANQKLFAPSDIQWIGKNWGDPDFTKMTVYNNRVAADHSTVNIITPVIDTYLWEFVTYDNTPVYYPKNFEWVYKPQDSTLMYSYTGSGVQRLANDNTLICNSETGYTFEVTPDNEIVWEYKTPFKKGTRARQGDTLKRMDNITPQLRRYAENYPAFSGRTLTPSGFIELARDTNNNHIGQTGFYNSIRVYPNPSNSILKVESYGIQIQTLELFTITGQKVAERTIKEDRIAEIDVSDLPAGLYFLSVNQQQEVYKIQVIH